VRATARKVLGDLAERPARTALVGVATAVGSALLVAAFAAASVLTREIEGSFLRSQPPHVVLVATQISDADEHLVSVQNGVEATGRRRVLRGRARSDDGHWQTVILSVLPSLSDASVSVITSAGRQSLHDGGVFVERSSLRLIPLAAGDTLHLRFSGGHATETRVTGIVHDGGVAPGWQDRVLYAYTDRRTAEALALDASFDELRVVATPGLDARALGRRLGDLLAARGMQLLRIEVPLRAHPHADQMGAVLALIGVFAAVGLVISGTLMATMMLAMLRGQVRQIAIMKAIGVSTRRLRWMFVAAAAALTVPSVVLGAAGGMALARAFVTFAATELNLDAIDLVPSLWSTAGAVILGCAVPVIVSWMVCRRAAGQTVVEAMQNTQVQVARRYTDGGSGPGRSASSTYASRNVWRQPTRAALAAVALALGGTTLMSATNVYRSLVAAVDRAFSFRHDDVDVRLAQPVDVSTLDAALRNVAGVRSLELWGGGLAVVAYPDGTTSGRYSVSAPPLDTELLSLPAAEGRWLSTSAQPEIVVTRNLLAKEQSLALGQQIRLLFQGRTIAANLVGVVDEVSEPSLYLNPSGYRLLVEGRDAAGVIRFRTAEPDVALQAVDQALFDAGVTPAAIFDRESLRRSTADHFVILLVILSAVAAGATLVGGLALATATSVTMIERRREIGVLRSLGAADKTVLRLCGREPAVVVGAAVIAAVGASLVMSLGIGWALSRHALHVAIPFSISPIGMIIWLLVAATVAVLAVWVPMRVSLRLPARAALVLE